MTVITTTRLVTDLRVTKSTIFRGGGGDDNNVVNCLVCFITLRGGVCKKQTSLSLPLRHKIKLSVVRFALKMRYYFICLIYRYRYFFY